jgi:hypothetical protein
MSAAMNAPRWLLLLACATTLAFVPARAAVLVHEFALRGTLNDSVGTTPLTSLGGQITALGYVFAANQGLAFSSPSLSPINYSLEFSFRLDTVAGNRKLVDFTALASNFGVYDTSGVISFPPNLSSGSQIITPGTNVHVVITRNSATGVVSGYVNGQLSFSFTDTALAATALTGFRFFVDDIITSQTEASGGTVNYMRFYNGALTQGEVTSLFAAGPPLAVPEPSTYALLSVGGIVMAVTALRRRRR